MSRRRALIAGAVVLLAAAVGAIFWFEPHKLFIDDEVDEALPVAAGDASPSTTAPAGTATTTATTGPSAPAGPVELAAGAFVSHDHETTGRAVLLELPDGSRFLRFEDLRTDNGPDLKVYLSAASAGGDPDALDDDFLDLGTLKGNIGSQNYEIPADVDLSRFRSAVVWCRRFSVSFGAADLVPT